MMAIVAEGARCRIYLAPTPEMEVIASKAEPAWTPEGTLVEDARAFTPTIYGFKRWSDLFTPRQLVALTTFCDLVTKAREKIHQDAMVAGVTDDSVGLDAGGIRATAYAEAVSVYLGMALSRWADLNNSICTWNATNNNIRALFSRQAVQMSWDFVELCAFAPIAGFDSLLDSFVELFASIPASVAGTAEQADAQEQRISLMKVVSTDPPYYDNVPYADLADFFYVWQRRALRSVFPNLFATLSTPKQDELVAFAYRHTNGKVGAEAFFLDGMTQAMGRVAVQAHPAFPVAIYYAFKQSESDINAGTASTGWETFLAAVNRADLAITGTWPIHTERAARTRSLGSNALASSIVLVCRKRLADAPTISRREFLRELNAVLPEALDAMTKGAGDDRSPVAPVDLSQAIIGPGMAVFSKYAAVLEADGTPMSVRTALQLINRFLAEDDFDADTQFCLHWFDEYGWNTGPFGEADVLARAKGTSVGGVKDAGVVESGGGSVRLRKWSEYPTDWDPKVDTRNPVWETLHHLIRALKQEGETPAGLLLAAVRGKGEATRQLAYRLYTLCERQGWAEDARAYNELITSWNGIESAASAAPIEPSQPRLFE